MSGKSSRTKGHNFERFVARKLRDIGMPARRCRQAWSQDNEPDVATPVLSIECKVGKSFSYEAAMRQAKDRCVDGTTPIAVFKRDRQAPVVMIELDDFLELCEMLRVLTGWGDS